MNNTAVLFKATRHVWLVNHKIATARAEDNQFEAVIWARVITPSDTEMLSRNFLSSLPSTNEPGCIPACKISFATPGRSLDRWEPPSMQRQSLMILIIDPISLNLITRETNLLRRGIKHICYIEWEQKRRKPSVTLAQEQRRWHWGLIDFGITALCLLVTSIKISDDIDLMFLATVCKGSHIIILW